MSTRTVSSRPGRRTSAEPVVNIFPSDTIERAIFEQGLRIVDVHPNKELDLLVVMLNTRDVVKVPLSGSKALAKASEKDLSDWQLIGNGYGVHWPAMDEHLSLKGFLRDAMMGEFLHRWSPRKPQRSKAKVKA